MTILTYLPTGNPLTLESVLYGLAAGAMLCAVLLCVFYVSIHGRNFLCERERVAYLRACAEAGQQEAYLTQLPYNGYTFLGTPHDADKTLDFLRFYGLPEDMRLTVVSYDEWYQLRRSL